MKILIRQAHSNEIDWINERYREVDFVPSDISNEVIAIAEVDGQKAGLGRLIRLDDQTLELGGMYVFDSFRKLGLARKIVRFLLEHVKGSQTVFCIAFSHLKEFYEGEGFRMCQMQAPKPIQDKYCWCASHYKDGVLLLVKKCSVI